MAVIAEAVTVIDRPIQHVRDCLEPPMGVAREALDVVLPSVRVELVEQQEWVELRERGPAERPPQPDAGPLDRRSSIHDARDLARRRVDRWRLRATAERVERRKQNPRAEGVASREAHTTSIA
jgi:hypothetical protein